MSGTTSTCRHGLLTVYRVHAHPVPRLQRPRVTVLTLVMLSPLARHQLSAPVLTGPLSGHGPAVSVP